MPTMKVSVPHNLGQDEARNRLQSFVNNLKSQYGAQVKNVQENWSGNRGDFAFSAMGINVKGSLSVQPSSVDLEGDLPITALPFKGTIENTIKSELSKLLS
ncbi:MAG: polyhydroxyalkanoic acid system family protein [Bacteroidota bacterium]